MSGYVNDFCFFFFAIVCLQAKFSMLGLGHYDGYHLCRCKRVEVGVRHLHLAIVQGSWHFGGLEEIVPSLCLKMGYSSHLILSKVMKCVVKNKIFNFYMTHVLFLYLLGKK